MALTDNTETLQNILEEVYNLPNRSSGSSVDATIFIEQGIGETATNDPLTFTVEDFQYDENEILNVYNKLKNGQNANVQILGEYYYNSSSGYKGAFTPMHLEYDYHKLYISFMATNKGAFCVYTLYFDFGGNDDETLYIHSTYLYKQTPQMVIE